MEKDKLTITLFVGDILKDKNIKNRAELVGRLFKEAAEKEIVKKLNEIENE